MSYQLSAMGYFPSSSETLLKRSALQVKRSYQFLGPQSSALNLFSPSSPPIKSALKPLFKLEIVDLWW